MATPVHEDILPPHSLGTRKDLFAYLHTSNNPLLRLFRSNSASKSQPNILDHSLRMRFHEEWLHDDCPVYNWYKQLAAVSSTRFNSIEHRSKVAPRRRTKSQEEYLVVILTDGSVCRLQREAYRVDSIQWFPAKLHLSAILGLKLKEPSKSVMKVTFPREFDLLDVLAICYGINKLRGKRIVCQIHEAFNTLLCSTVLAILSRLLVRWEKVVLKSAWPTLVSDELDRLRLGKCQHGYEYIGFGICDIVDPSHPNPRHFILDPLRRNIRTRALNSYLDAASKSLWFSQLNEFVEASLQLYVSDAVYTALTGDDIPATRIRSLLESKYSHRGMEPEGTTPEFIQFIGHERFINSGPFEEQNERVVDDARHPDPMHSIPKGFWTYLEGNGRSEDPIGEKEIPTTKVCAPAVGWNTISSHRTNATNRDKRILALYKVLRSSKCNTPQKRLAVFGLSCDRMDWGTCLNKCLSSKIIRAVSSKFPESDPNAVRLRYETPESTTVISVRQLQDFIRDHIKKQLGRLFNQFVDNVAKVDANLDTDIHQVWMLVGPLLLNATATATCTDNQETVV